jgi:hypothetical protein
LYSGTTAGYRDDTGFDSPERLYVLVVREPMHITVRLLLIFIYACF